MSPSRNTKSVALKKGFRIENKQERIRKTIVTRIKERLYVDRLPNIHDLAKELGANFKTVNKVLNRLASEGLLLRKPGLGTIVKSAPSLCVAEESILNCFSFPSLAAHHLGYALDRTQNADDADIRRVISGGLPDIEGSLLPLTRQAEQAGWYRQFTPEVLRLFTIKGTLYALPLAFSPMVAYINPAFFEARGLAVPEGEFDLETLVALQAQVDDGPVFLACPDAKIVLPFLWHQGLPLQPARAVLEGLLEPDQLGRLKAYRTLKRATWREAYWPSFKQFQLFATDSVGIMLWGAALFGWLPKAKKKTIHLAPLATGGGAGTVGFAEGLAIPKRCPVPERSFAFLQAMLEKDVQTALTKEFVPLAAHPAYRQSYPSIFTEEIQNIRLWQESLSPFFVRFLRKQLMKFLYGDMSSADWAENIRSMSEILLGEDEPRQTITPITDWPDDGTLRFSGTRELAKDAAS